MMMNHRQVTIAILLMVMVMMIVASQQDTSSSNEEEAEAEDNFEQTNLLLEQIRNSVNGTLFASGMVVP
jgi:large-conductance mechanosensitive channel